MAIGVVVFESDMNGSPSLIVMTLGLNRSCAEFPVFAQSIKIILCSRLLVDRRERTNLLLQLTDLALKRVNLIA